ncbi:hypothetical protein RCIP0075_00020 [Klebsiella phage RCIP0075]
MSIAMNTGVSELWRKAAVWISGFLLVSVGGVTMVMQSEDVRTTAYPDPATKGAPWTICWGHTGPEVHKGLTVSIDQCRVWLRDDLKKAQDVITRSVRVPLRQGEMDAYASFVFNVGGGNWRSSTLLRKLNAGDHFGACNELPRWIYANRMEMKGLRKRRTEERDVCLSGGAYVYRP